MDLRTDSNYFSQTELTLWFSQPRRRVFTARYGLDIYIKFRLILTFRGLTINPICIRHFIPNYSKSGKSLIVYFLLIFFQTTVLILILYGYETWSLAITQESSLNTVKRKSLKFKRSKCWHEEGEMSHCDRTDLCCCPRNRVFHEE